MAQGALRVIDHCVSPCLGKGQEMADSCPTVYRYATSQIKVHSSTHQGYQKKSTEMLNPQRSFNAHDTRAHAHTRVHIYSHYVL